MKFKHFAVAAMLLTLAVGCEEDQLPWVMPKDGELDGQTVDLSGIKTEERKLFVLNEGGMGSNNSTLDFLRFSDGSYVTSAFRKMNPDINAGLGDVGNAVATNKNELWIVVNNSGIVEVLNARNETEIATIAIPTPRAIAFDDYYAYVTSWAGAYATYGADYSISDYKNPVGCVYRISLSQMKVVDSVEVGYQPEGIAYYDGYLYVANSGGIASQLPPDWAYDKRISVINTATFKVEKNIQVEVNLKDVYADGKGNIFVTTLGNYFDVHSGLFQFNVSKPSDVKHVADYVSCSTMSDGTMYWVGTADEFDWSIASKTYQLWCCTGDGVVRTEMLTLGGTPYGICVLPTTDGAGVLVVGDAGDYFNPGTVTCYSLANSAAMWSANAGVCPGHFALW